MTLAAKNRKRIDYYKLQIWYIMRAEEIREELACAAPESFVFSKKRTAFAFIDAGRYIDRQKGLSLEPKIEEVEKDKYMLYFVDAK